mmetsp:Transcript_52065/g.131604  ORF Transcript_52065/g.131604 Transcript_52065/m.131604 type:complete len:423 (-) Transcript_52065:64-1332(-)
MASNRSAHSRKTVHDPAALVATHHRRAVHDGGQLAVLGHQVRGHLALPVQLPDVCQPLQLQCRLLGLQFRLRVRVLLLHRQLVVQLIHGKFLLLSSTLRILLQLEIRHLLLLLRGLLLECQRRALLDGFVVHPLQCIWCHVSAEHNSINGVPHVLSGLPELHIGLQRVQLICGLEELVELLRSGPLDHIGRDRVDKVSHRVVCVVQHLVDVDQLIKYHQLHGDEGVVLGANVLHIVIHLCGDRPQLGEAQGANPLPGPLHAVCGGIRARPAKLVDPLGLRLRNVQGRAAHDGALSLRRSTFAFSPLLLAVDDDQLLVAQLDGGFAVDGHMLHRVDNLRRRARPELGPAVAEFDLEVLILLRHRDAQLLELSAAARRRADLCGPIDDADLAVGFPHGHRHASRDGLAQRGPHWLSLRMGAGCK